MYRDFKHVVSLHLGNWEDKASVHKSVTNLWGKNPRWYLQQRRCRKCWRTEVENKSWVSVPMNCCGWEKSGRVLRGRRASAPCDFMALEEGGWHFVQASRLHSSRGRAKWKSREKIGPTHRLGFGYCRGILGGSFGDRLMAENGIAFKSWLSVWSSRHRSWRTIRQEESTHLGKPNCKMQQD